MSGRELGSRFSRILEAYPSARGEGLIRGSHPVRQIFREASSIIADMVADDKNLIVKWSTGQGRWAAIPWIAVLDKRSTTRTSSGVYIAYLFRDDSSGVFLTLSQAASEYGRNKFRLRQRVHGVRIAIDAAESGFLAGEVDVGGQRDTNGYNAGAIISRLYEAKEIPPDSVLRDDLSAMRNLYLRAVALK